MPGARGDQIAVHHRGLVHIPGAAVAGIQRALGHRGDGAPLDYAVVPWDITEERPVYHIKADVAFRDVDPTEYSGLFVSGGRAPEYIRYDKDLMRTWHDYGSSMREFMKLLNTTK